MLHRMVLCGVFTGCGFQASMARDGGGEPVPGDAATDGALDGPVDAPSDGPRQGSSNCFEHWRDGSLAISQPQELATLSTGGNERDPWISDDRRTLYFASNRTGSTDIYRATRLLPTAPFGSLTQLVNLSLPNKEDDRPALTADERTLVLASDRDSNGKVQLYITLRPDKMTEFGSPNQQRLESVNVGNAESFDPFLTGDGRTLYLAPSPDGPMRQHIAVATRSDVNRTFTSPTPVAGINDPDADTADPALSPDQRVIVFSSERPGGSGRTDLWYATRAEPDDDFQAPVRIPVVNSPEEEGDPMLSADGCELYFASTRGGDANDFDLYVAQIAR